MNTRLILHIHQVIIAHTYNLIMMNCTLVIRSLFFMIRAKNIKTHINESKNFIKIQKSGWYTYSNHGGPAWLIWTKSAHKFVLAGIKGQERHLFIKNNHIKEAWNKQIKSTNKQQTLKGNNYENTHTHTRTLELELILVMCMHMDFDYDNRVAICWKAL